MVDLDLAATDSANALSLDLAAVHTFDEASDEPLRDPRTQRAPLTPAEFHTETDAEASRSALRLAGALARYGDPPQRLWNTIPYFVRVYLQRRLLIEQLAGHVAARKQAVAQQRAALTAIGRQLALLSQSEGEEIWRPLARHLAVVRDAQARLKDAQARQARARESRNQELADATHKLAEAEQETANLRAQRDAWATKLDEQQRKSESTLQELRRNLAPERHAALPPDRQQADREQLSVIESHLQRLTQATAAAEEWLSASDQRRQQAEQHLEAVAARAQRTEIRCALSDDGAAGSVDDALVSLAENALRLRIPAVESLSDALPALADQARLRSEAEAHCRGLLETYDKQAYSRGRLLLVGGTLSLFLALSVLIFL